MTIDKAKLKALAEAMLRDEQGAELSGEEVRGFPEAVRSYEAMTAPSAVLALLAEIERLSTSRSKKERELEQELETWRHGPFCWTCGDTGDVHDITGEWRGECDCLSAQLINANRERDQLKDENAQLKNHEIELKAENEVLRKQVADLSPFKNASPQDYRASNKCLACGYYHHGLGNLPCPRCTPVAQSAMAKESSHD
ncbi:MULTISPECIES: hypothetical protein [Pseudomonas putida group]|uniref:hypothetical protein n=1 Tax=Pseudomonas putida group TaxID=136845 RepID=UPI00051D898E|nr:hypothetical protein [Pseudomonas plecoglossicida]KGK25546.1 hypothetical protein GT93_12175 [Pseudomonas plecoglossicida]